MCEKENNLGLIIEFKNEDDMQTMLEKAEFVKAIAGFPNSATALYRSLDYIHQLYKFQLDGWKIELCKSGYDCREVRLPIN